MRGVKFLEKMHAYVLPRYVMDTRDREGRPMIFRNARRSQDSAAIAVSIFAVVIAILAFAATTAAFFFAAESARHAAGDVVMSVGLFGLPLFEGFRSAGRLGVHAQWGVPVMAVMFLTAATVLTVLRHREHARRTDR